ncbi:heterogeneous nuclear ribonucleoprotein F, partial [Nephila pilipes]
MTDQTVLVHMDKEDEVEVVQWEEVLVTEVAFQKGFAIQGIIFIYEACHLEQLKGIYLIFVIIYQIPTIYTLQDVHF